MELVVGLIEVTEMNIEERLREHPDAVIALAVEHDVREPRVFGSVVRGEAGPESDIDLLVRMDEGRSLFDLSTSEVWQIIEKDLGPLHQAIEAMLPPLSELEREIAGDKKEK